MDNSVGGKNIKGNDTGTPGRGLHLDVTVPRHCDLLASCSLHICGTNRDVLGSQGRPRNHMAEEHSSESILVSKQTIQGVLGKLAKASLVGANTVKGPALARVSTSPAALTAASKVESWGVAMASSAMFLVGAAGATASLVCPPLPIWWWWPGAAVAMVKQVRAMMDCMLGGLEGWLLGGLVGWLIAWRFGLEWVPM